MSTQCRRKMFVKSGFLDKPRSNVMFKHYMNQDPRYVTEFLMFNQLSFPQLVGGECRTILRADSQEEIWGRLRILSKVAYLFYQCKSWERARATYYAILGSIEEGEAEWTDSFSYYDLMCLAHSTEIRPESSKSGGAPRQNRIQVKKDFFCRDFQRGECSQQPPHKA